MQAFITDNGSEQPLRDTKTGEVVITLPRYGIWKDLGRGKPEVAETSNDLQYLLNKYNLTEKDVYKVGKQASWAKKLGVVDGKEQGRQEVLKIIKDQGDSVKYDKPDYIATWPRFDRSEKKYYTSSWKWENNEWVSSINIIEPWKIG